MGKKINILDYYDSYIADISKYEEYEKKIVDLARRDYNEFQRLIDRFDQETFEDDKLFIADFLVKLHYEPLKNWLLEVIEKSDDHGNKIWAAGNLVKLDDIRGCEAMKRLAAETVKDVYFYEIGGHLSDANNVIGLKTLLEIAEKNQKMRKLIVREEIEKRLKELEKASSLK